MKPSGQDKNKQHLIFVLLDKGQCFCVSKKYQEAIEIFDRILTIDKENPDASRGRAFAVSKLKEQEKTENPRTDIIPTSLRCDINGDKINDRGSYSGKRIENNTYDEDSNDFENLQKIYID